jgi:hypothetical protein
MDLSFLALPGKNDPHFVSLMRDLIGQYLLIDWDEIHADDDPTHIKRAIDEIEGRLYTPIMDIALFLHWWDNR